MEWASGMKSTRPATFYATIYIALGYTVGAQLGFLLEPLPHWNITLV